MKFCSDVHTGVGTPHRINDEKTRMVGVGVGWGGPVGLYSHFVAPSCKLELARFSAKLSIQDGA